MMGLAPTLPRPRDQEVSLRARGASIGTRPGLLALGLLSVAPLLLLLVPLVSLAIQAARAGALVEHLADPMVGRAFWLSLGTTSVTLLVTILFGTPLAYLLARYQFPGRRLVDTLVDLPIVLPPAVAGMALLMAFGRRGVVGSLLSGWGVDVAFTTAAVVLAQTFVAAPFYVRAAKLGLDSVDPMLERVSATLGVSDWDTFRRVTLPLAWPSLVGGAIMAWARATGEFGATIMFAGNLSGRTQTMPLAIYTTLESDLGAALMLSLVLMLASFAVLWLVRRFASGTRPGGRRA